MSGLSTCGTADTDPYDKLDPDNLRPVVTAVDIIKFKQLLSEPVGPKCPTCPLECVGDACP